MGSLTTITIYNDGAHMLEKHPEELANKLYEACLGVQRSKGQDYDSLGNFANLLTLQKPRHADSHTLYLHAGNTVMDIDEINDPNSPMFEHALSEMKFHIKRLNSLKKSKK